VVIEQEINKISPESAIMSLKKAKATDCMSDEQQKQQRTKRLLRAIGSYQKAQKTHKNRPRMSERKGRSTQAGVTELS